MIVRSSIGQRVGLVIKFSISLDLFCKLWPVCERSCFQVVLIITQRVDLLRGSGRSIAIEAIRKDSGPKGDLRDYKAVRAS